MPFSYLKFDNLFWNLFNYFQQSIIIPKFVRSWFLLMMGCNIHRKSRIASGVFLGSNKIQLAASVFININCFLDGCALISMDDGVHLGPYVKILTGSHTINPDVMRRSGESKDRFLPVYIKRGSWIGMGSIILPGVTIAEGCVVGAGSVVVHSTQSNGLYVGNPAKRIKDLPVKSNSQTDTI
ncbi:MAG: acyltransferase [Glaciimonas sp.]|nr:acyltransferase [Glaciimonas sp.]